MYKWFVYYNDDYYDNGSVGFKEFDTESEAAKFIEERMASNDDPLVDNYKVIYGYPKSIKAVEIISKIKIYDL